MQPELDLRLAEALPTLIRLQNLFNLVQDKICARQKQFGRALPAVNFAELALIASRPKPRLATWITTATAAPDRKALRTSDAAVLLRPPLSVGDLLLLRSQLAIELSDKAVVPTTKLATLATFLSVTPCPTTENLATFAGIHASRAKVWLACLAELSLLKCQKRPNELVYLNLQLVGLIADVTPSSLSEQFDLAVSRRDWLKRSAYRSVLS